MYMEHCRDEMELHNNTDWKQIASFHKTTYKFVVVHLQLNGNSLTLNSVNDSFTLYQFPPYPTNFLTDIKHLSKLLA
jgi:hypothetical protein